jgi:hypothetical protein
VSPRVSLVPIVRAVAATAADLPPGTATTILRLQAMIDEFDRRPQARRTGPAAPAADPRRRLEQFAEPVTREGIAVIGKRAARRVCRDRARRFQAAIPTPFDIRVMCDNLGRMRGRTIHLLPLSEPDVMSPCGLWLQTEKADYVFYDATSGPLHQEHIVLHELGHMLSDHAGVAGVSSAALLLPNLNPGLISRVLGRSAYSTHEEQEAEWLATELRVLIDHEADLYHGPQHAAAADDSVVRFNHMIGGGHDAQ